MLNRMLVGFYYFDCLKVFFVANQMFQMLSNTQRCQVPAYDVQTAACMFDGNYSQMFPLALGQWRDSKLDSVDFDLDFKHLMDSLLLNSYIHLPPEWSLVVNSRSVDIQVKDEYELSMFPIALGQDSEVKSDVTVLDTKVRWGWQVKQGSVLLQKASLSPQTTYNLTTSIQVKLNDPLSSRFQQVHSLLHGVWLGLLLARLSVAAAKHASMTDGIRVSSTPTSLTINYWLQSPFKSSGGSSFTAAKGYTFSVLLEGRSTSGARLRLEADSAFGGSMEILKLFALENLATVTFSHVFTTLLNAHCVHLLKCLKVSSFTIEHIDTPCGPCLRISLPWNMFLDLIIDAKSGRLVQLSDTGQDNSHLNASVPNIDAAIQEHSLRLCALRLGSTLTFAGFKRFKELGLLSLDDKSSTLAYKSLTLPNWYILIRPIASENRCIFEAVSVDEKSYLTPLIQTYEISVSVSLSEDEAILQTLSIVFEMEARISVSLIKSQLHTATIDSETESMGDKNTKVLLSATDSRLHAAFELLRLDGNFSIIAMLRSKLSPKLCTFVSNLSSHAVKALTAKILCWNSLKHLVATMDNETSTLTSINAKSLRIVVSDIEMMISIDRRSIRRTLSDTDRKLLYQVEMTYPSAKTTWMSPFLTSLLNDSRSLSKFSRSITQAIKVQEAISRVTSEIQHTFDCSFQQLYRSLTHQRLVICEKHGFDIWTNENGDFLLTDSAADMFDPLNKLDSNSSSPTREQGISTKSHTRPIPLLPIIVDQIGKTEDWQMPADCIDKITVLQTPIGGLMASIGSTPPAHFFTQCLTFILTWTLSIDVLDKWATELQVPQKSRRLDKTGAMVQFSNGPLGACNVRVGVQGTTFKWIVAFTKGILSS